MIVWICGGSNEGKSNVLLTISPHLYRLLHISLHHFSYFVLISSRGFDCSVCVFVAVVVVVAVVVAVAVVAVVAFVVAVVADVVTLVNPRPEGQICLVTLR